jgi:hypothetical protein
MKKIVLKNLPSGVVELIDERAKADHVRPEEAVVRILHDVDIERMIEHDMAILREGWEEEGEGEPRVGSHCCCHQHLERLFS